MPTASLRVASIEDERVSDEELVMAIGKYSDLRRLILIYEYLKWGK